MKNLLLALAVPVLSIGLVGRAQAMAMPLASVLPTTYTGEINSISYNAAGEACAFVVGGPPPKELEIGKPSASLTKLLQRLLDNDTKVEVEDKDANDKFDGDDTIKEQG
jgi:hypothetical protein